MNRYDDVAALPIHVLLFDQPTDVNRFLNGVTAEAMAGNGALRALIAQPGADPDAVTAAIVQVVTSALARSGPDLVLDGLVKVGDLVRAGRETSRDPDLTVVVPLGSHRIDRRETQTLQISVGPFTNNLACQLDVAFDLEPVNATVMRGRLVHIGDARCRISASFSIASRQVVHPKPRTINLAAHLRLGSGLPLVPVVQGIPA